ncbi:SET domain-containing protein-lysine N-methyltransferase [Geobacter sp. AOG2]|uniref:SET domain-containing protein-lysine N-methyltransferase n=1 Tax=Geobacter sp. AOG2 TaxID=1566347 RepID=UPI001CC34D09|nr:SET domain-containing protein [Geobacter sp. AOG2]GFE62812.1 hypothetical protein AOG2_34010 [Geobacter sp. AOG2]
MKKTPRFKDYANTSTLEIEADEEEYLYIRESRIPGAGNGLFTAIPIYRDEVISLFKGRTLSEKEAQRRVENGQDAYFMNMPDGTILDSMDVKCFAKYANDATGAVKTAYRNNATITLDEKGHVCIVANRRIPAGGEIYCAYGTGYWKKRSATGDSA